VRKDANLRQRNTGMTQHHSAKLLLVNCALPLSELRAAC
jgi:hypothetical protein